MNTNYTNVNQSNLDAKNAHLILCALAECSSLSEEMENYKYEVQKDLGFTNDDMYRYFNLRNLATFLTPLPEPVRLYKGKEVTRREENLSYDLSLNQDTLSASLLSSLVTTERTYSKERTSSKERTRFKEQTVSKTESVNVESKTEESVTQESEPVSSSQNTYTQTGEELGSTQSFPEKTQSEPVVSIVPVEVNSEAEADAKAENEVKTETEPASEPEKTTSDEPKKDPHVKILRKLLQKNNVPRHVIKNLKMDPIMYDSSVVIPAGDISKYRTQMEQSFGKLTKGIYKGGAFIFKKAILTREGEKMKAEENNE